MSGPKRTADKVNTIGIVVIGICSAVLVYVTIVALQAFYMDDTSEIQVMADYGGQDTQAKKIRAEQTGNIRTVAPNPPPKTVSEIQTYRIPIQVAMQKVVDDAKKDASLLVPAYGAARCRTLIPGPGRAKPDDKPPCAAWGQPDPAPAPTPPVDPNPNPDPNPKPAGAGTGSAAKPN